MKKNIGVMFVAVFLGFGGAYAAEVDGRGTAIAGLKVSVENASEAYSSVETPEVAKAVAAGGRAWAAPLVLKTENLLKAPSEEGILQSGKKAIKSELNYKLVSARATCRPPQWDGDSFSAFFSESSYKLLSPFLDRGYSAQLLDKTCGAVGGLSGKPELSSERYEPVTVLLVDYEAFRRDVERQLREAVNSI